jgi:hypothetical protein
MLARRSTFAMKIAVDEYDLDGDTAGNHYGASWTPGFAQLVWAAAYDQKFEPSQNLGHVLDNREQRALYNSLVTMFG